MTAVEEPEVLQLAGATEDRDTSNDLIGFVLGDAPEVYTGKRPKMAVLLKVASALDDDTNPMAQAAAFDQMIEKILTPESSEVLRARLLDDDDDLDLDSPGIQQMFKTLVGLWYGGPIGGRSTGRPGSRGSQQRTGRRSTVRARSGGSTRSR